VILFFIFFKQYSFFHFFHFSTIRQKIKQYSFLSFFNIHSFISFIFQQFDKYQTKYTILSFSNNSTKNKTIFILSFPFFFQQFERKLQDNLICAPAVRDRPLGWGGSALTPKGSYSIYFTILSLFPTIQKLYLTNIKLYLFFYFPTIREKFEILFFIFSKQYLFFHFSLFPTNSTKK
jgi:hypothetical protein